MGRRWATFIAGAAIASAGVASSAQTLAPYFDFPSGGITGSTDQFVAIKFPKGISVAVPRAWRVLDKDELQLIDTTTGAALDLSGIDADFGTETLLVAASSMPRTTYASMRLSLEEPLLPPDEVIQMKNFIGQTSQTNVELRKLADQFTTELGPVLGAINQKIIGNLELRVDRFGQRPALVIEYRRTGLKGPVAVQMNYVLGAGGDAKLTLSYRETESFLWKPVLGRIRYSLTYQ